MKTITKQDIEIIAQRKLLDWEYEGIVKYIKALRDDKSLIMFARRKWKN